MKTASILLLAILPLVVHCFHAKFGPYDVSGRTLIYRGVYMYDTATSPKVTNNGKSRISLNIQATHPKGKAALEGSVITAFMTSEAYANLGYVNTTGHRVPCCDDAGVASGRCRERNSLYVNQEYALQLHQKTHNLKDSPDFSDFYTVGYTSMFYVVAAICDPSISENTHLEGTMTAENPYGHLPATHYFSLPFYSYMSVFYVVALILWGMLCIQYSKETMSVHIIILIVLISFVVNYIVKVIHLWIYNSSGYDMLLMISVIVDVFTRTLTRILTILVCMGLGISRASINDSTLKLVIFSFVYFAVNMWDSFVSMQPPSESTLSNIRIYVTAGMDALVYFWVFQSLMNTMDDLKQNKQNAKLAVFIRLYTLLLISVVVSTITLVVFSYIVNHAGTKPIWEYQWLMNEGIWCVYYFGLFLCLMMMWRPSENSAAYAYHHELATDVQEDEEYGLPQDKLIESGDEGDVVVNTTTSEMKPMGITEGTKKA